MPIVLGQGPRFECKKNTKPNIALRVAVHPVAFWEFQDTILKVKSYGKFRAFGGLSSRASN